MALHFPITADNRQLIKSLEDSQNAVKSAMKNIEDSGIGVENLFHRIERAAALSVAGFSLKGVIDQAIQTRSYFQDIESSMKVFLGSEEKAVEFTKKLQDAAYYNMFEFSELADASKQLIAYRNNVEDVIPIINKLSEVATATKTPLAEMVSLYNRAKSTGTVDSQAIQSWATKGVVLKDIMKDLGVVTAGTSISFDQLNMALNHITDEGGMFHGIMDAQMDNLSANIGQLEDNLSLMFNDIGSHLEGVANTGIKAAGELVDHWQEALAVIATIAASYGVNKAVEVGGISINKASTSYGYDVELEHLRALLPAKEEEEQSTLKQALASGRLSEAKALEIEETRKQVDALLEEVTAREALAKSESDAAINAVNAAQEKLRSLEDEKQGWLELYTEATNAGDAELAQSIATEIATKETEINEAANLANAASEQARTAATNLATASQKRETLATQINTAQTAGNTAATKALALAKEKLAIAIGKVNKVIAANKFALITAAIIALGTAIYKVCTYQSDFQKSLEKVSLATEDARISSDKEIKTLDELKAKLSSCAKGSDEWKSVKDAIVKQFGQYIPQLNEEITKVGILSTAYNDLKKSIIDANKAKNLIKFIEENDNQKEINEKWQEGLKDWEENTGVTDNRTKEYIKRVFREYATDSTSDASIWDFLKDRMKADFGVDKGSQIYDGLKPFIQKAQTSKITEAHKMKASNQRELDMYLDAMGFSKDDYERIIYGIEKPSSSSTTEDRNYWELEVKNRKAAYEAIKKEDEEGSEKALKSLKEAESKLAEYNDYKVQNKKTSGTTAEQTASNQKEAFQKIADLMKSQHDERVRIQQEYEFQIWQNRIDLMEEGEAKVLAQMELDNKKELSSLEEQKQQAIQAEIARQKALWDAREEEIASRNKGYGKKVFNGDREDTDNNLNETEIKKIEEQYAKLYSDLLSKQQKAESDRLDAAKESMNAYLKEFGSYQEKRLAIQEEYETKISEAQNEGERMQLIAGRNKALSDLDYDEWIDTGAIALAFGEISKLSDKTITKLISDMEKYREKVITTFDPDKIQKYEDALAALRKAQTDTSFGALSSIIPDYIKQRKVAADSMDSAEENLNQLYEQRTQLLMKITSLKTAISSTEETEGNTDNLKSDLEEVNAQLDANDKAIVKSKNAFKQLQEEWDKLNTPEEKFKGLTSLISSVGNEILSIANAATDMLSSFGVEVPEEVIKVVDGLSNAVGGLESMDLTRPFSIITGAFKTLAGIGQTIGGFLGLFKNDKKHEKNIERLQKQIDSLNKSYEKLSESLEDAFSTDASNLIDQQNTLLQQQKQLIRLQIAEEEAKKKTDADKIKEWKEQLAEIDETIADNKQKAKEAIIGEDLKSAINEFASLYAEAWNDGTDAAQKSMAAVKNIISSALSELLKKNIQPAATKFYDTLVEAMNDGILTDAELNNLDAIKRQIDALVASSEEQYKMIQERYRDLDEIKEDLTDISFDSVRDNFKSKLADMKSDASSFTDDFSDMLRNALIDGLMDTKYDNMLKEWYDEFAEKMDDRKLTDEERDVLRQKYDAIVQQGLEDRDFINSIVGGGAYSQEASKGGWETMGQDQAEELNGRFTALTELEAINNSLVTEGNVIAMQILDTLRSLSSLTMVTDGDNSTLREIRDMMFLSTGHLEDISKYTKQLITIREGIDKLNDLINNRL